MGKINNRDFLVVPFIGLLIIMLVFTEKLLPQTPGAVEKQEKIKSEISILESILDDLIVRQSPLWFKFNDHVNGAYLDGFGLLFDVESYGVYDLSNRILRQIVEIPTPPTVPELIDPEADYSAQKKIEEKIKKQETERKRLAVIESKSVTEKLNETKDLLMKFFLDYATTVKTLQPEDQICVNIRITADQDYGFAVKEKIPTQVRACAKISDLTKYRQGKMTDDVIKTKINIDEKYDNLGDKDIQIMESIFNSVLSKRFGKKMTAVSGSTRGWYLNQFGVIFFIPVGSLDLGWVDLERNMERVEEMLKKAERHLRETEEKMRQKELTLNTWQPYDSLKIVVEPQLRKQQIAIKDSTINLVKDDIVEVLGSYGHTLKNVKDNEWIMIAVELGNRLIGQTSERLYIKVRKADVLRYSREQIGLDSFKKTIVMWQG